MPCNLTPKQADEFFKDPDKGARRIAAVWDIATDKYIKHGADLNKTLQGVSGDTGFPVESLKKVLRPNEGRSLTNEMWAKQFARRTIGQQIVRMAEGAGTGKFTKAYKTYDSLTRKITTFGHYTVFGKTHGGDNLWTNPVEYARNFVNSVKLTSLPGTAKRVAAIAEHESRMSDMHNDTFIGPKGRESLYAVEVRSKLDVTSRSEANQVLGGGKSPLAHAAFEELQLRRHEAFKREFNKMPAEARTADNGQAIAEVVNNRWGGGAPGRVGSLVGKFLFGPRLTPAQWRATFVDTSKAVYNGILNRKNATPGEIMAARMVGRRMGSLVGAYGSVLAAEAAAAQFGIIDKRNMPNVTNPADTGSFGRIKIFGKGIPLSPTIELLALPVKMVYAGYHAKPNENPIIKFAEPLLKYGLYRLSPGLALGASLASGKETFSQRTMPWHKEQLTKKKQPVMAELTHPKLTYTEFLGERMPIPVAVLMRDAYDEMRADGIDHPTARILIQSLLAAGTTGVTGYEWHPDVPTPYKQAEQNTPENASDKQRAHILNRAMQDFKRRSKAQPEPREFFGFSQ